MDVIVGMSDTTRQQVAHLRNQQDILSHHLNKSKVDTTSLLERVEMLEKTIEHQSEELDTYRVETREKEMQMDILREQVTRRNKLLDEQRVAFHKELMQLKMKVCPQVHL